MASQVFDKILQDAVRKGVVPNKSRESVTWFRRRAQGVPTTAVSPSRMLSDADSSRFENRVELGSMYMFMYDPKTKADLPYYDRFPLIFPVGKAPNGFYGLNMHYLHPRLRAVLFDRLTEDFTHSSPNGRDHIIARYKVLKAASKYRYFEPCFKHYLNRQVKSRFIYIAPAEWNMALFLPTERFEKATKQEVWKDTIQQLQGGAGGNAAQP